MDAGSVVIELTPDLAGADLLMAAGLSLLPPTVAVTVALRGVEQPTEADARRLTEVCLSAGELGQRSIELVGEAEAHAYDRLAWVAASETPRDIATAIAKLAAVSFVMNARQPAAAHEVDAPTRAMLRRRDELARRRDGLRRPDSPPTVVVIAQVQSTWSAVDAVVRAMSERPDLSVEIVAIESDHEVQPRTTWQYIENLGWAPRDIHWLERNIQDSASPLAGALFYDPWDGLRPEAARAQTLAAHGIRLAYIPYGTNVGAGASAESYAYNLPLHQLATRIYARSSTQKTMYKELCAAGDAHVVTLGVPKFDRMRSLPPAPQEKRTVLWNPHFSVEPGGWSTFLHYVDDIIAYAERAPDLHVLARPHFRILRDAAKIGGILMEKVDSLQSAARRLPNLELDTAPDYADAFARADAMISDLSSLFPEFLVTGKPIMYLHRTDSPGINRDAQYFFEGAVALDWACVELFLDDVQSGRDGGLGHRQLTIQRHFEHLDGLSSVRIAEDISSMTLGTTR